MLHLSSDEVKSLKKVLEYVLASEEKSFHEYIADGGDESKHVYYHASMLTFIVNLKGEMPKIKLTGDTSLDKFNKGE